MWSLFAHTSSLLQRWHRFMRTATTWLVWKRQTAAKARRRRTRAARRKLQTVRRPGVLALKASDPKKEDNIPSAAKLATPKSSGGGKKSAGLVPNKDKEELVPDREAAVGAIVNAGLGEESAKLSADIERLMALVEVGCCGGRHLCQFSAPLQENNRTKFELMRNAASADETLKADIQTIKQLLLTRQLGTTLTPAPAVLATPQQPGEPVACLWRWPSPPPWQLWRRQVCSSSLLLLLLSRWLPRPAHPATAAALVVGVRLGCACLVIAQTCVASRGQGRGNSRGERSGGCSQALGGAQTVLWRAPSLLCVRCSPARRRACVSTRLEASGATASPAMDLSLTSSGANIALSSSVGETPSL